MAWAYRAGRIAVLVVMLAGLLMMASAGVSRAIRAQDAADVIEAGSGPLGERSFALVGRNVYGTDSLQLYGYLSAVVGLDAGALFTGDPATVGTARFTYVGELEDTRSINRADITTTEGAGTLRIYFNEAGGASWSDPASFSAGEIVAEFTIQMSDVLQRQAPGVGVVVGDGQALQVVSAEFTVNGDPVRFGRDGMERRLRYVGALAPDAAGAATQTALTGSATMTGRESRPVPLGGATAAAATPDQTVAACAGLQPWLDQTVANLDRALVLGNTVAEGSTLETLDGQALAAASEELVSLASAQRELASPADADAANRLAVTAISTVARGLRGLADAASGNDAETFAPGEATLADGRGLVARADEAVRAYGASCLET